MRHRRAFDEGLLAGIVKGLMFALWTRQSDKNVSQSQQTLMTWRKHKGYNPVYEYSVRYA